MIEELGFLERDVETPAQIVALELLGLPLKDI